MLVLHLAVIDMSWYLEICVCFSSEKYLSDVVAILSLLLEGWKFRILNLTV